MATRTIVFDISSSVSQYSLSIGSRDVEIFNNSGSITLKVRAEPYTLRWWMSGNPLKGITIVGKIRGNDIVKVTSKIPPNTGEGAGHKRFTVKV